MVGEYILHWSFVPLDPNHILALTNGQEGQMFSVKAFDYGEVIPQLADLIAQYNVSTVKIPKGLMSYAECWLAPLKKELFTMNYAKANDIKFMEAN